MKKKILFLALSLFLIAQSYKLLQLIPGFQLESFVAILFVAWILNMFITGIFAFAGFGFPTQKLLPESYYKVAYPQKLNRIYDLLGVNTFRKMLLATIWRGKKQRKNYFNGKASGIEHFVMESKKSEFGHLIPFVILVFISGYFFFVGFIKLGVFTLLYNILGNFYPVILQRHHRMRIQLLKERLQSRTKK